VQRPASSTRQCGPQFPLWRVSPTQSPKQQQPFRKLSTFDAQEPHLTAIKRILHYLQGTPNYGLLLHHSSSFDLVVYTDADWAGYPDTRRSTSSYAVFLGDNLVYWSTKRQTVVSRSNAKAEYRVVANGVAEATWLRQLLHKL
jgi:hypothetical protein